VAGSERRIRKNTMSKVPCGSCATTLVPPNHICLDCVAGTPQLRQDLWERLQAERDYLVKSLRDQFAMAALQGMLARGVELNQISDAAYTVADAMLVTRKLPESG
jgi:hypothetical protein